MENRICMPEHGSVLYSKPKNECTAMEEVDGREAFVGDYVERRLLGLSDLSVKSYYDSVALAK